MIHNDVVYNPDRDLQEVDQFGYIDLVEAFRNGYVPGEAEAQMDRYNDIEEPSSIIGKPSDCFEAMRMQDEILKNSSARAKFEKASGKSVDTASVNSSSKDEN